MLLSRAQTPACVTNPTALLNLDDESYLYDPVPLRPGDPHLTPGEVEERKNLLSLIQYEPPPLWSRVDQRLDTARGVEEVEGTPRRQPVAVWEENMAWADNREEDDVGVRELLEVLHDTLLHKCAAKDIVLVAEPKSGKAPKFVEDMVLSDDDWVRSVAGATRGEWREGEKKCVLRFFPSPLATSKGTWGNSTSNKEVSLYDHTQKC